MSDSKGENLPAAAEPMDLATMGKQFEGDQYQQELDEQSENLTFSPPRLKIESDKKKGGKNHSYYITLEGQDPLTLGPEVDAIVVTFNRVRSYFTGDNNERPKCAAVMHDPATKSWKVTVDEADAQADTCANCPLSRYDAKDANGDSCRQGHRMVLLIIREGEEPLPAMFFTSPTALKAFDGKGGYLSQLSAAGVPLRRIVTRLSLKHNENTRGQWASPEFVALRPNSDKENELVNGLLEEFKRFLEAGGEVHDGETSKTTTSQDAPDNQNDTDSGIGEAGEDEPF